MSQGDISTDHGFIRKWIEERGGRPTRVKGTEGRKGEGILRVDFAEPDEKLEEISWDEFFDTFEDRQLGFLHQDRTADEKISRFFKFVHCSESDGAANDERATGARGPSSSRRDRDGSSRSSDPHGKGTKMAKDTEHRGQVKDSEHDGRLKENREAGRTKETTPASAARAHGGDPEAGKSGGHASERGHSGTHHGQGDGAQHAQGGKSSGGSDDLKSREYRDEKGEVHHHTRTYMDQHHEKK